MSAYDEIKEPLEQALITKLASAFPDLEKEAQEIVVSRILNGVEEGMSKEAGLFSQPLGKKFNRGVSGMLNPSFSGEIGKKIRDYGSSAVALAGVGAGLTALHQAKKNASNLVGYRQYQGTLENVIAGNEMLASSNRERLNDIADSIYGFAPNVSQDANLLENLMVNANEGEVSMDPATVRALLELEEKHQRLNEFQPSNMLPKI